MKNIMGLLILLFLAIPSLAQDFMTVCSEYTQPVPASFCVYFPKQQQPLNNDVVYYFHGLKGNVKTWEDPYYYTAQIRKYWQEHKIAPPIIVAFSFGPEWLLAEKNSSPVSGLMDVFVNHFMPLIENKLINGIHGRRILLGESMGGFNSLQLALKTKNLFNKAAVLCAPMAKDVSPFSSPEEIKAYIEKSTAWQYHTVNKSEELVLQATQQMVISSRYVFPTPQEWASADPYALAEKLEPALAPEFYLAVGFHDRFAALEGNEELAKMLIAKGIRIEWRPQWGGHCAMDIPSLAEFLVK